MIARLYGQARGAERHAVEIDATLRGPSREAVDVVIEDLSTSGFRIPSVSAVEPGTQFSIGLPGLGTRLAVAVRDASGRYGCVFLEELGASELQTALTAEPLAPLALRSGQAEAIVPVIDATPAKRGWPVWIQVGIAMVAAATGWWLLH